MADLVQEARQLLAQVTPGEWWWQHGDLLSPQTRVVDGYSSSTSCQNAADAEFIAAAPRLVRGLADELDTLRAQLAQVTRERDEMCEILKSACDRSWENETPRQIASIAANAIYWRQSGREAAEQRLTAQQALLNALLPAARWLEDADEAIRALKEQLRRAEYAQHTRGCNALRCMRCGCSVSPINQHLAWIGGEQRLQHDVEIGVCTCGLTPPETT